MNAHGVKVFHGANGYNVSVFIPYNLKLYLFPARYAFFNQNLCNRRKPESVCGCFYHFFFVVNDTAARSAQSECRANNKRIAYFICKCKRIRKRIYNLRRNNRLVYFFHHILKKLSVLSFVNRFGICAQKLNAVFIQKALLGKLHRKRQSRLTSERGKQAVGTFFFYNSFYNRKCERFYINFVRHAVIRHNCSRV